MDSTVPGFPTPVPFFATAARGTEGALRDELRELGIPRVKADRGGVHFGGGWEEAWRACLYSRIAIRVLAELARFDAPDGQALYDGVRTIDWSPWLTPRHTLAVSAACRSGGLTHTGFIAQKTKDGVVDQIRDRVGERPSVDRHDPDVALFVHLVQDHATVYLDLAGESLHRRGYRTEHLEAPLKETLAAAVLRLSGWNRTGPLVDPMCGSGTFPIEAAMWARNIAPGLMRSRFGFERWACHDATAATKMADLRNFARSARRMEGPEIIARDLDPAALAIARSNARKLGIELRFEQGGVAALQPLGPTGVVVVNPPYGARLDADPALYDEMVRTFRRLPGHTVAVLAGSPAIEQAFRRRPDRWQILFNGDIECRLLVYQY